MEELEITNQSVHYLLNINFNRFLGDSQSERLKTLTKTIENDPSTPFIDESKLQQVIILESSKTFLRKQVDEENKSGYFTKYKELVESLSEIILRIKPDYKYSHSLISTIIESTFHQRFFAKHLPRLSDNLSTDKELEEFNLQLIFGVLK